MSQCINQWIFQSWLRLAPSSFSETCQCANQQIFWLIFVLSVCVIFAVASVPNPRLIQNQNQFAQFIKTNPCQAHSVWAGDSSISVHTLAVCRAGCENKSSKHRHTNIFLENMNEQIQQLESLKRLQNFLSDTEICIHPAILTHTACAHGPYQASSRLIKCSTFTQTRSDWIPSAHQQEGAVRFIIFSRSKHLTRSEYPLHQP